MKKFRLFALLAVLATFSTVFAAWQYISYAETYQSDAVTLSATADSFNLVTSEAISLEVTNADAIEINYSQSEETPIDAVATISDDIEIQVMPAEDGALDQYDFYYVISGNIGSLMDLSVYETDGVVNDYNNLTKLEVAGNGMATILKDDIAPLLTHTFTTEDVSADKFGQDVNKFINSTVVDANITLKIYAKKIA